jgi:hypothetical protein
MTHDTRTTEAPETPARRRRFPLTAAALIACMVAVPIHLIGGADRLEEEAVAAPQVEEASTPSPELAARSPLAEATARELPVDTPAVSADPASTKLAESPTKSPPPAPTRHATGATTRAEAPIGGVEAGRGGLGLVGTTRGGGGLAKAGPGSGVDARHAAARRSSGPLEMSKDEATPARDGADGYDSTIRAGQLTAGAIDDLGDTKLLDELRSKVGAHDPRVLQAIPEHAAVGPAPGMAAPARTLQIGIVLDTTGSMGDEIEYLKTEIRSIAEEIGRDHPNVDQRYALVAYKDHGDVYVVRSDGFQPLDGFVTRLGAEDASGGGDFPEALDEGMEAAAQLQWSGADAAKLVFVIADAPPHDYGYTRYAKSTVALAGHGVSIYPVASSGVDTVFEYLMRWAARTTGGKYLFLTDHSGIGDAHATPVVDRYELKPLRNHMLDVIRGELAVHGSDSTRPNDPSTSSASVVIAYAEPEPPSWIDRHGLFILALGGVFLLGFAGDMATAAIRRRPARVP